MDVVIRTTPNRPGSPMPDLARLFSLEGRLGRDAFIRDRLAQAGIACAFLAVAAAAAASTGGTIGGHMPELALATAAVFAALVAGAFGLVASGSKRIRDTGLPGHVYLWLTLPDIYLGLWGCERFGAVSSLSTACAGLLCQPAANVALVASTVTTLWLLACPTTTGGIADRATRTEVRGGIPNNLLMGAHDDRSEMV